MEQIKRFDKIKKSSEKNFGIVFGTFFLLVYAYIFFINEINNFSIFFISIFFYFFSFIYPKIFIYPNKIWHYFGLILGHFISQIIMAVIFLLVVTPIGLFKNITNKDFSNKKITKTKNSYWIERSDDINSMKNQY